MQAPAIRRSRHRATAGRMTTLRDAAGSRHAYEDTLRTLSEASSTGPHFEAFKDIAWDSPEFAAPADDPRWTLPEVDPLSRTDWFRGLPAAEQRRIARLRIASITKTGSQFEQLLLLGGTQFLMGLANENPEFRYFMHELTEETHHIQMFQEFTNRVAPEVHGGPTLFIKSFPLVGMLGSLWPSLFFQIILAGEEPIDHIQKSIMRGGGIHPLTDRIMEIHLAEEARHIGFAHAWLRRHAPRMSRVNRLALGVTTPLIMRIGFWGIVVPSRQDAKLMGIPRDVLRDTYSMRNRDFRRLLSDACADVRSLADANDMRNRLTLWSWRRTGTDGRPSRYRSEPSRAAA
ncbi:AurF N-oxygenase family protein [Tomitella gaofuii]|uniref:AurF N-oxygenase family protein n=1 Tax=Tomitella gaofuii TaxID=2760083 RepID=UPI0015FDB445|nr:diiron oxygenase [Tomitella gaofuii]